jgi:hypothetical protein
MATAGRSARSCQDRSPIPGLSRDIYGSYAVEILVGRQWMSGSRPQEQDSAVRLVFASASSKSEAC